MMDNTEAIIEHSLQALMKKEDFLPDLQGDARDKAFSSLLSILSTPNHIHKSFLRVTLRDDKVVRIPAFRVQHNNTLGLIKGHSFSRECKRRRDDYSCIADVS